MHPRFAVLLCVLLGLAGQSGPTAAQPVQQTGAYVYPNPARAQSPVTAVVAVHPYDCFEDQIRTTAILRQGNTIRVQYEVVDHSAAVLCFSPPAPSLDLVVALGGFAPGDYVVVAEGNNRGLALPTATAPFSVQARTIPAASPAGLLVLGLALALLAWRSAHRD